MTVGTRSMQNKKKQGNASATKQEAKLGGRSLFSFFGDIKAEFKKITWTSRDELIAYTKIVIVATFLMGVGIFTIDLLIQNVLAGLSEIIRLIVG